MMQLEEKEFQLAQLLEDVADLHYPVAMKKGIDVLLDPSDSSITRISHVKGDPGKLKQILCNLLSNAVKFTSVGHVLIRARARKPSLENSIIASNKQNGILNRVSRLFYKNKQAYEDLEQLRSIKQNANCMEFVFEVEDTGPGIPKEKRKSVFENFVQVKETAAGQLGTGLGLGIVQSLVRLMGGDIEVVDKEDGSCGTCCRFNIFLIVCGINPSLDHSKQGNLERGGSSGLSTCGPSPKTEGSAVVLLMHSDGRRKMVHRYMEGLGLRVLAIKQARHLPRVLKKLKTKLTVTQYSSSSGKSDYVSSSSDQRSKFYPLSAMDGADEMLPVHHLRANLRGAVKHALLLIDTNAGEFSEICRAVAEFRKDLYRTCCCNVIWLERPDTRGVHGLQEENLPPTDHVISEPLHGSRLLQVVRYLPEFEGSFVKVSTNRKRGTTDIGSLEIQQEEIEELGNSSSDISLSRWKIVGDDDHGEIRERESSSDDKYFTITNGRNSREKKILAAEGKRAQQAETEELVRGRRSLEEKVAESQDVQEAATPKLGGLNPKGPLTGKRVLIAEDTELLAKLAVTVVSRLDAMVERCKNGKEAVELVGKGLGEQACYNFILMDCQMPVMDGFEATKEIRKEEKKYGVHIPIIALTAHTAEEEGKKIVEAGMDFHLTKPLNKDRLLDALRIIHENQA